MSDNSDNADRAEKSAEENLHGPTFEKAIELFKKTLDKHLDRKLTSHKREILDEFEDNSSHLRKKIKKDTELLFRFKGNKKQFQFNEEILAKVETLEKHIIKGKTDSAIDKVSDIRKELNKRNKLIRMADKSQAGWACVEEYLSDELASDSEDDKKIRAAENRALRTKRFNRGRGKRGNFQDRPSTSQNYQQRSPAGNWASFRPDSVPKFRRQPAKTDICWYCQALGHWSRDCFKRKQGDMQSGNKSSQQ